MASLATASLSPAERRAVESSVQDAERFVSAIGELLEA
jgi:hypothetical protein